MIDNDRMNAHELRELADDDGQLLAGRHRPVASRYDLRRGCRLAADALEAQQATITALRERLEREVRERHVVNPELPYICRCGLVVTPLIHRTGDVGEHYWERRPFVEIADNHAAHQDAMVAEALEGLTL